MFNWQNETVVILASGPSLTAEDAQHARVYADRVIAVNESWRLCQSADVLYAADSAWWKLRAPPYVAFGGVRVTCDAGWHTPPPDELKVVPVVGGWGPIKRELPLFTGKNSAFQAMHLAIVSGAKRVVFLGLDMTSARGSHWHGDHGEGLRNTPPATFDAFRRCFELAAPSIVALGVEVLNASPGTALACFPVVNLREVLP